MSELDVIVIGREEPNRYSRIYPRYSDRGEERRLIGDYWIAARRLDHASDCARNRAFRGVIEVTEEERSSLLTGTVIYTRRGRQGALDGALAEQVDRIRVSSGRVGAHTCVWFQTLASAHQQHLMRRHHPAFPLDRLLQVGDAAQKKCVCRT